MSMAWPISVSFHKAWMIMWQAGGVWMVCVHIFLTKISINHKLHLLYLQASWVRKLSITSLRIALKDIFLNFWKCLYVFVGHWGNIHNDWWGKGVLAEEEAVSKNVFLDRCVFEMLLSGTDANSTIKFHLDQLQVLYQASQVLKT